MRHITINLQESDTLKIQLTIATNMISSKDVDEEKACKALEEQGYRIYGIW